jgi:hypothetical protein
MGRKDRLLISKLIPTRETGMGRTSIPVSRVGDLQDPGAPIANRGAVKREEDMIDSMQAGRCEDASGVL